MKNWAHAQSRITRPSLTRPFWAAAPKGTMTYAALVSAIIEGAGLEVEIRTLRLEFWP